MIQEHEDKAKAVQYVIDLFSKNLESIYDLYIPKDLRNNTKSLILFDFNRDSFKNTPLNDLPLNEKYYLREMVRAYLFFRQFDFHEGSKFWPELAKNQIKIYALKAHIDKSDLNLETRALFNCFFDKVMSMLPKKITASGLDNLNPITTLDSSWYNCFVYNLAYQPYQYSLSRDVNVENYQGVLSFALGLTTDSLLQFATIESVYDEINGLDDIDEMDEVVAKAFLLFLSTYAKNNLDAAAAHIVEIIGDRIASIPKDSDHAAALNSYFGTFSARDLFLFLRNGSALVFQNLSTRDIFLENLVKYLLANNDLAFLTDANLLNNFKSEPDTINVNLIEMQVLLLKQVNEIRPDLLHHLDPIKEDLRNTIHTILSNSNLNPIGRDAIETFAQEIEAFFLQLEDNADAESGYTLTSLC